MNTPNLFAPITVPAKWNSARDIEYAYSTWKMSTEEAREEAFLRINYDYEEISDLLNYALIHLAHEAGITKCLDPGSLPLAEKLPYFGLMVATVALQGTKNYQQVLDDIQICCHLIKEHRRILDESLAQNGKGKWVYPLVQLASRFDKMLSDLERSLGAAIEDLEDSWLEARGYMETVKCQSHSKLELYAS